LLLICLGVENVHASYLMYKLMHLTFIVGNDNFDLEWTSNGNCILQSLIIDVREPYDTGIGDVWKLNFKPIGLIVARPYMILYNYSPICQDLPNNCYVANATYETRSLDCWAQLSW
jgi:hypothetical protein